jgi:Uncharacterized protein conserved in bacteria
MRVSPFAVLVCTLLGAIASRPGCAAETVVADHQTDCRIRDSHPDDDKTIHWTGPCRNGFAHGGGVLEWEMDGEPGGWAEGVFVDGRLEGPARIEWADGRAFTGRYRNGLASGHGILTFPEGHRYVGSFDRDRPTGRGEFISSMGIRYAARVDASGNVWPGAMLGPRSPNEIRSAEAPTPGPQRQGRSQDSKRLDAKILDSKSLDAKGLDAKNLDAKDLDGKSLDEWLREPPLVPDLRLSSRPPPNK